MRFLLITLFFVSYSIAMEEEAIFLPICSLKQARTIVTVCDNENDWLRHECTPNALAQIIKMEVLSCSDKPTEGEVALIAEMQKANPDNYAQMALSGLRILKGAELGEIHKKYAQIYCVENERRTQAEHSLEALISLREYYADYCAENKKRCSGSNRSLFALCLSVELSMLIITALAGINCWLEMI